MSEGINIAVTMQVLVRDGRALMLSTSDDRWGFELDAEERVLALAEQHGGSLVLLKGWGYFIDDGRPTLNPRNSHEPMTWQVLEPHEAALAAAHALSPDGQYVDISRVFLPEVRLSGDGMTAAAIEEMKSDFQRALTRPGCLSGFSIGPACQEAERRAVARVLAHRDRIGLTAASTPKKSITPSVARATHQQDDQEEP